MGQDKPLAGIRVIEHASGVSGAWAGRLLAAMGATVIMVEPPSLCPLRREAPLFPDDSSALFAYVAAGKKSVICDLDTAGGRDALDSLLTDADILIDDTPVARREALALDPNGVQRRHPHLVYLSVLPFGASGPKATWTAEEINLIHAGGEGFLLPNGLSADLFPGRPPLKIAGHFAEVQGGVAAALSALAALWSGMGQFVDASVQDANVAVGAFALQRFGDGSIEHRSTRSFRFGGVIECQDGHVELLTLEERQWQGLILLMDNPDWAQDPALSDPGQRSAQGDAINARIRDWARTFEVEDLVAKAQKLSVPMARYNTPEQILDGPHERTRGTFQTVETAAGPVMIQAAPFRFGPDPLLLEHGAPEAGADQNLIASLDRARRVTA